MNIELSQKEVNLLLESMESYRESIDDASLKVTTERRRAKIAEVRRNVFALTHKLQNVVP
jgi:hypothetical protein